MDSVLGGEKYVLPYGGDSEAIANGSTNLIEKRRPVGAMLHDGDDGGAIHGDRKDDRPGYGWNWWTRSGGG